MEHLPKISGDGLINFFGQEPGVSRDWNSFSDEHPCPKSVIHSMSCIACCEYVMLFGFTSFASCKGFWCISFRLCNIICGAVLAPVTSHWSSHSNWAPLYHVDLPLLFWGTRVELMRENLCHPFYSRQTQARYTDFTPMLTTEIHRNPHVSSLFPHVLIMFSRLQPILDSFLKYLNIICKTVKQQFPICFTHFPWLFSFSQRHLSPKRPS